MPESPRWLVKHRDETTAKVILSRIGGAASAEQAVQEIRQSIALEQSGSYRQLWGKSIRPKLFIGIFLAIFQQLTGINIIMYYAPVIFESMGMPIDSALLQTVAVGAINLVFTFVAILLIDRIGRRPLLILGTALMVLALLLLATTFFVSAGQFLPLIAVLIYIASFAASLGPVTWVIISELFPNQLRGRAMSVSILFLWSAAFVLTFVFPMIFKALGGGYTFLIVAGICVLALIYYARYVPETKGQKLEEIN